MDSSIFDIFLLEAVLNGLLLGGLLALLALGLNLIFGVIDVVWICYAELIMVGMYAIWWMHVPMWFWRRCIRWTSRPMPMACVGRWCVPRLPSRQRRLPVSRPCYGS